MQQHETLNCESQKKEQTEHTMALFSNSLLTEWPHNGQEFRPQKQVISSTFRRRPKLRYLTQFLQI